MKVASMLLMSQVVCNRRKRRLMLKYSRQHSTCACMYLQYHILHVDCSTHCDAFNAAGGLSNKLATSGKAAAPTTLSSWVSMMPGAQALADSMEQDEPVMPGGLNLVVMGPPLAGKSTQAHMLADRYQLVVITIDELLMVPSMKHSLSQPDD